jgi:hypothetical protein
MVIRAAPRLTPRSRVFGCTEHELDMRLDMRHGLEDANIRCSNIDGER